MSAYGHAALLRDTLLQHRQQQNCMACAGAAVCVPLRHAEALTTAITPIISVLQAHLIPVTRCEHAQRAAAHQRPEAKQRCCFQITLKALFRHFLMQRTAATASQPTWHPSAGSPGQAHWPPAHRSCTGQPPAPASASGSSRPATCGTRARLHWEFCRQTQRAEAVSSMALSQRPW